jgi:integrase
MGMAGRKPITEEQEPALLAALEKASARDALIVLASLHLGFRISETLSLDASQIWEGGRVKAEVKIHRCRLKGERVLAETEFAHDPCQSIRF